MRGSTAVFPNLKAFMLFFFFPFQSMCVQIRTESLKCLCTCMCVGIFTVPMCAFCERLLTIKTYAVFGPALVLLLCPDIHTCLTSSLINAKYIYSKGDLSCVVSNSCFFLSLWIILMLFI